MISTSGTRPPLSAKYDFKAWFSTRPTCSLGVTWLVLCLLATVAQAAVYNIHLYTDSSPDYCDRESFLATATSVWQEPQDQAIALWRWGMRHHRQSPATFEDGRGLWDPILFYNSYANTFCGYMAGFQTSYWDGMGGDWKHRYTELGDHTVAEASWDGGATWHMFDTSMGMYCLRHDGSVASCPDIQDAHSCALSDHLGASGPEPGHLYLYHSAPECGTNPVDPAHAGDLDYPWGYRTASDDPVEHSRTLRNGADSFTNGFSTHTSWTNVRHGWVYRLQMRRHEVYTRYWSHLGETEDYYRPNSRGDDPDELHIPGDLRGNGLWEFSPDLSTPDYRRLIYDETGLVHRTEDGGLGPALRPAAPNAPAAVVFKVNGANVITSAALSLSGRRTSAADSFRVDLSRDAGINWESVWSADPGGDFSVDLTLPASLLGGAHEYLVRIVLYTSGDNQQCGLDDLALNTVTQVNRYSLPALVRGRNHIRFELGQQAASHLLWPPLHDEGPEPLYQRSAADFHNVYAISDPESFYSAVLRPLSAAERARVTWRFDCPTPIVGLRYGGSFIVRNSGSDDFIELQHSFDGAAYQLDETFTGESSATWDGRLYAEVDSPPPGQQSVWLRYEFACRHDQSYTSAGVQDALMYVLYEPRDATFEPLEVTYCWTEHRTDGDVTREYSRLVTSDSETWQINVAGQRDPTLNWIRINLAGYGPGGGAVTYGYSDGEDVGPGADYNKQVHRFDWLDSIAYQKPYTVSRSAAALNPDDGGELTDGCIIPPTRYRTTSRVQPQTALWDGGDDLEVVIDLGGQEPVAALRITTHQPDSSYCHADSIVVAVSGDDVSYQVIGTIRHRDVWSPTGDRMRWGFEGSPAFAQLPAGGRLAFPFWLLPDVVPTARYVRCRFAPQAGRGIGISEIQVLSAVTTLNWPDREVYLAGVTAMVEHEPEPSEQATTTDNRGSSLTCAPNPFNAVTTIHYRLLEPGAMELSVFDITGRRVRQLARTGGKAAGSYSATWDGRDDAGRSVASGLYFFRLQRGWQHEVSRVMLVK
ncbi:MAG: FlgD immunoglobulin-like domain containing protein [bacterium]